MEEKDRRSGRFIRNLVDGAKGLFICGGVKRLPSVIRRS